MAKLSSVQKNLRRQTMSLKFRDKREALKAIVMNKDLPLVQRFDATLALAKMPRNSAFNRVRNRCELSGRARGFYRKFKLSRICVRSLANEGKLPGVLKASW